MNKLRMYLAIWFLKGINIKKADEAATWDDAQNFMEKTLKGNCHRLKDLNTSLMVLAHRANERADDLFEEQYAEWQKQVMAITH